MSLAPERDDAPATIAPADHEACAIDEHRLKANQRSRQRNDMQMCRIRAQAIEQSIHPDRALRGRRDL
jgi:hypothetical protein